MPRRPSSSQIVLSRLRQKQKDVRRLTDAHAEWLIGDRDEPAQTSWMTRLRRAFRRRS